MYSYYIIYIYIHISSNMCSNVYFLRYICHTPSPEPEKSFRDTLTDWSRNLPLRSEAGWVDGSNQRKTGDSVHFQVETSDLPYGKPGIS